MAQITIYVDGKTESKIRQRAKAQGLSVSKWIVRAIQSQERDTWPEIVIASLGTWDDVPDLQTIRSEYGKYGARVGLD